MIKLLSCIVGILLLSATADAGTILHLDPG